MAELLRTADFQGVTEFPGTRVTRDELRVIYGRYRWASQFVPGKEVLEVGCGPGLALGYLERKGARKAIGGDITEMSVRTAQRHYQGKISVLLMDAHHLPFKNHRFDIVMAMAVACYLHMPAFLEECRRVLTKEGLLVFCMSNRDAPGFRRSPLSTEYYSAPELLTLLKNHNFDPQLFGVFPVSRGGLLARLRASIIFLVGKFLGLFPKEREIKEALGRVFLGRTLILTDEIDDGLVEAVSPVPLNLDSTDNKYRVFYVVARFQGRGKGKGKA